MHIFEERMTSTYINDECDIQFPLSSISELAYLERQLEEEKLKIQVV